MTGADGKPLLLLSRFGEGRVALLLSDHIWLWARGYEGGGPHLDLLRRTSHWLMKQPDLERRGVAICRWRGRDLVVQRQTMADSVAPVTVTSPSGATRELTFSAGEPGTWTAAIPANELGLWQATDGTLKALINVGPTNPKEFSEVTLHDRVADAAGAGDRRRRAARRRWLERRAASHRPGAGNQHIPWRRLDGREDARRECRQGRRAYCRFRRADRLLLLLGAFAAHLAARGR